MTYACTTVTSEWPAVTAIVNTYNRAELLVRALDSVANQTYNDFEVIVVHDGPMDEATMGVLDAFEVVFLTRGVRYTATCTDECSGYQCVPKNAATILARGDYIAYLDDDNEWTNDHLEVLVEAMERGSVWPDFVYGRRENVVQCELPPDQKVLPVSPYIEFTQAALKFIGESPYNNFIDTSDTIIARGALWRLHEATGMMWNTALRRFGDWELFTRALYFADWRGAAIDHVVQRYYWHGKNLQFTRPAGEGVQMVGLKGGKM